MISIVLQYKRDGVLSTGQVLVRRLEGDEQLHDFERSEFVPMMEKFANALRDFPDAKGILQRTDREGLSPYHFDDKTIELFRTEPDAIISSMNTPYSSPQNIIQRKREEITPTVSSLRVGHNTLSDAFGEELYTRFDKKRNKMECPCCGIWSEFLLFPETGITASICKNPNCSTFEKPLLIEEKSVQWVAIQTFNLLATHSPRFYFPRAWNNFKPWISWEALNSKYQQFQKEKSSCL